MVVRKKRPSELKKASTDLKINNLVNNYTLEITRWPVKIEKFFINTNPVLSWGQKTITVKRLPTALMSNQEMLRNFSCIENLEKKFSS